VPACRTRALTALGVLLAVASIAVPSAWGIHFHATGLALAVTGSVLLVGSSALALNGSRPTPLPVRQAVPAVLATTAANAVTPAGIGGTVLVLRLHRRSGLSAEQAAAAAGLRTAVGALTATLTTAVVASAMGPRLPGAGHASWLLLVLPLVAAGLLVVPRVRARLDAFTVALWDVVRRPRCCLFLLLGCLGVTAGQLLALQGAVQAVGGHVASAQLLVALLGSAAARSAVPSPGGVGPIEAALIAGLTALGLSWAAAATAVAVYRTAGFVLPVVAGVVSLHSLRRRDLL
jgi:uncharacterized membrane protein YbhN (UPF0104 family)